MDDNLRSIVLLASQLPPDNHFPIWKGYSLRFIQHRLHVFTVLQIRLQDRWRGSSREALPDCQTARVLEGVEHLPAKEASSTGNKHIQRHFPVELAVDGVTMEFEGAVFELDERPAAMAGRP